MKNSLKSITLPARLCRLLEVNNIYTINDLRVITEKEIPEFPEIGEQSIKDLKRFAAGNDFEIGDKLPGIDDCLSKILCKEAKLNVQMKKLYEIGADFDWIDYDHIGVIIELLTGINHKIIVPVNSLYDRAVTMFFDDPPCTIEKAGEYIRWVRNESA